MRRVPFQLKLVCLGVGLVATFLGGAGALGVLAPRQATSRPTTTPATRPASSPTSRPVTESADTILERLLNPPTAPTPAAQSDGNNEPEMPRTLSGDRLAGGSDDATGRGPATIAPDTPVRPLVREGTFVVDRTGRVRQSVDARGLEFVFSADGESPAAAVDPPMLLVPNLNLMAMERAMRDEPDRRFRVTGRVTEYRGRNYLILDKVVELR